MLGPEEIRDRLAALCRRLGPRAGPAGRGSLDCFAPPGADADPEGCYLYGEGGEYHYLVKDRGCVSEHHRAKDLDELLYFIMKSDTQNMACDYELAHRVPSKDGRRMWFPYQVELMRKVSPAWAKRLAREQRDTLEQNPFDDHAGQRARLCRELRAQGLSDHEVDKEAYSRYPDPAGLYPKKGRQSPTSAERKRIVRQLMQEGFSRSAAEKMAGGL